jgi:hypothetical protein
MHQLLIELANYVGKAWAHEWLKKSDGGTAGPTLESAGEADLKSVSNERKPSEPFARTAFTSVPPATPGGEDAHP